MTSPVPDGYDDIPKPMIIHTQPKGMKFMCILM